MFLKPNPPGLRANHPLNNTLVGAWPIIGGGTRAGDVTMFRNHGTIIGDPTWGGGKTGAALYFDGVNDYIDLGNPAHLRHPQITVTARIVPNTLVGGTIVAYNKTLGHSYILGIGGGGDLAFYAYNAAGAFTAATVVASTVMSAGFLYRVTGTYDGVNLRLYLNNVLYATTAYAALNYTGPIKIVIGAAWNTSSPADFFAGWIDDVRIYARALSGIEIQRLYLTDFNEFRPPPRSLPVFPGVIAGATSNQAVTIIN